MEFLFTSKKAESLSEWFYMSFKWIDSELIIKQLYMHFTSIIMSWRNDWQTSCIQCCIYVEHQTFANKRTPFFLFLSSLAHLFLFLLIFLVFLRVSSFGFYFFHLFFIFNWLNCLTLGFRVVCFSSFYAL